MRYYYFLLLLLLSCKKEIKYVFNDNFENGLDNWEITCPHRVKIVESNDSIHKKVMALYPHGPAVYALIKGSEDWSNYSIEADFLFPINHHHYLGFIYNYVENGNRVDFGSIFLFGPYAADSDSEWQKIYREYLYTRIPNYEPGNVILVNPHRDGNASRLLYNEFTNKLPSDSAVKVNEWHKFKAEVMGRKCHFYIDNMQIPKITFDYFEFSKGKTGFKPRLSGSEVWIDNIKVFPINEFSYIGENIPKNIVYKPDDLITKWDYLGPFYHRHDEAATDFNKNQKYTDSGIEYGWNTIKADERGCILVGKITRESLGQDLVYFHHSLYSEADQNAKIKFSSTIPLVIWVNNMFYDKVENMHSIWYDFNYNQDHKGNEKEIQLNKGNNDIIILVYGGRYGGDGFYASIEYYK